MCIRDRSKDGATLFKSYKSASLKLIAPAGTRYIRMQFALGESADRSAKGEFYIKDPRLYLPETQAIVNANDFYSAGVLSDTVINVAQFDLAGQGFTVTSKNNPVSTLLLLSLIHISLRSIISFVGVNSTLSDMNSD